MEAGRNKHPQENAKWTLGKNGNCIVSSSVDGIMVTGAETIGDIDYYGGVLVCESIQKGVAELIIRNHEIVKELSKLTELDRDNLCDMLWWLKGYKKGADDNFENCPFHQDHLDTLDSTVKALRELLNKLK